MISGHRISEQALTQAFGFSRNTLREAFTVLAGERIVTRIPNHGVVVATLGVHGVRETYSARRILEPAAGRWATGIDVAALQEIIVVARAAQACHEVNDMATANQLFHETLVSGTGSILLKERMSCILAQMRLIFHSMSHAPNFNGNYIEQNAHLVMLLAKGRRKEGSSGGPA